jgi:hypothetical protein
MVRKTKARRARRKGRKTQRGGFWLNKWRGTELTNEQASALLTDTDNFPEVNDKITELYTFVKHYYDTIYSINTSNTRQKEIHDKIIHHNGGTTKQSFEELIELRDALRDLIRGSTTIVIPGSKISADMKEIRKAIEAATSNPE